MQLIGREREKEELTRLSDSTQAEFVVVYGRRRVGKTFLVRSFFDDNFTFYATGLARANRKEQIQNFYASICSYSKEKFEQPKDWYETFDLLKQVISVSKKKRKVVFLDEMPWMDTQKSEFQKALERFWNSWGCMQHNLLFIVCGSAASWIVKNIIRNKGGLHNRLTCQLHISPFTLSETKQYLNSQGINWGEELTAECYMILGGIPYYLHLLNRSLSLAQNIDRLFFSADALLQDEFSNLFSSLFKKSDRYERVISFLNKKRTGYSRAEISVACDSGNGGGLTRMLDELEQCGFIRKYKPLNSRESIYQLVDFFCLFYYQFINGSKFYDKDAWLHLQATPRYNSWIGLSFERVCFAHIPQIHKALGINGIATKTYPLTTDTAQLDMVIERADRVTTLCEMKYSKQSYSITKLEYEKLTHRSGELSTLLPSQKQVLVTLISNVEPKRNSYYNSLITSNILLKDMYD